MARTTIGANLADNKNRAELAEVGMDLNVEGKSERIPPGSHICQLYSKVTEIPSVTARLLRVGLALSEKCMFAAAPPQIKELCDELYKLQVDVEALVASGQLVLYDEREPLLSGGKRFDPYFLLSSHQTFIAQALREGWHAVRISIDMTWLTKDVASPEQILKYEAASDAVFTFQNAPIIALMHYDHSKLLPNLVVEVLKLHPISVVGKYIKRNPYYLNSEQYMLKILRINKDKGN
jgi:MEDS: MEthanogen/methylotroph, DcmR Sensory domain